MVSTSQTIKLGGPTSLHLCLSSKGMAEADNIDTCKDGEAFVGVDPTGRYGRYNELLGAGAMKKVYRAFDLKEGTEVAWNRVVIGDLGLAAMVDRSHKAYSFIGTPEYMAPELYEQDYNELVDVYSFGLCVLQMFRVETQYTKCTSVMDGTM